MTTPSADYRRSHLCRERKIHQGLDAHAHRFARLWHERKAKELRGEALRILDQARTLREYDSRALAAEMARQRLLCRRSESEPAAIQGALASIVETARRHTGLLAHPEQIMGALALARGFLAEMQTGEGKTLVIGLAAALAGWAAPACHVITANDYLAARDADWLRPFYEACGLTVDCVTGDMHGGDRARGYAAGITYTTAKEVTADLLRDQLQLGPLAHPARRLVRTMLHPERSQSSGIVLRGLHRAIIDEADHALIDESVTPLIISRPQENAPLVEACRVAHELAALLERNEDYVVHERTQRIELRPQAAAKLSRASADFPGMWNAAGRRMELITQALSARELFHCGKQYVIHEGKILIIDESTGRVMPQRTWRQGLHQAVEAKEQLTITSPTETLARLSFQRFFRLYDRLSGITGTGREAAGECWHIYHLPFVRIPTHRPCIRQQWPDRLFPNGASKWFSVVQEVERLHVLGRPVLVGTRSVAASEHVARLLQNVGLQFEIINAVRHKEEAQIVSSAGEAGRITIATNMAGRGTDIKLGPGVAELGGLHVLATERHESPRIDRQLFGRAGRQGDPGSAQAFVSLDDDLARRFVPPWQLRLAMTALAGGEMPAQVIAKRIIDRGQETAEKAARSQREAILKTDSWLDESLSFASTEGSVGM